MMTVSEFSTRGGVSPHVVRFYSRIGLLNPVRHPDNGYKLFSRADVRQLHFIRRAQALGYTLEEVREIFDTCRRGDSPCGRVREILRLRIEDNRRRLAELQALQARMEHALSCWERVPDCQSACDSLCCLIESREALREIA